MPWKLEKSEGGYYVVNQDSGKKMSSRPLTKTRAQGQLRALYASGSYQAESTKARKKKPRGNIHGLTKHLMHKLGGDPHFFTKVVNDPKLAGYPKEIRNEIAARAHKIATGIWPGEHKRKKESTGTTPTVRNLLEGKIHQSFTIAADQLFQRGYIDRDTRIALSGLIGDVLGEFGERFATTGLDKDLKPEDAEDIANKEEGGGTVSATPTGIPAHGPGGLFSTPGLGGAMPNKKKKKIPLFRQNKIAVKGGPGSGNYGHAGVPGKWGGSAPKMGSGAAMSVRTGASAVIRQRFASAKNISGELEKMTAAGIKKFALDLEEANKWADGKVTKQSLLDAYHVNAAATRAYRAETDTEKMSWLNRLRRAAEDHAGLGMQDVGARPTTQEIEDAHKAGLESGQKPSLYDPNSDKVGIMREVTRTDNDPSRGLEYVSTLTDYQIHTGKHIDTGGYQVEIKGGTIGVGPTKAAALKKARMNLFQHDILQAIKNNHQVPGETLLESGITAEELRRVRSGHPEDPEPWNEAIRILKKAQKSHLKELRDLHDEQRREYSRIINGTGDVEHLRDLRLKSRELAIHSSRVSVKDFDPEDDWVESTKESGSDRSWEDSKTKGMGMTVFKDKNGKYRWIALSSNAFRDRDREIVSTKALENDVDRADKDHDYGPLRWWHVQNLDIGDCDFNMMHGHMLVESGTFRDDRVAEICKEAADDYQISIGFKHPPTEPDRDGVFHTIRRFERSLVPAGRASNELTKFLVKGADQMATKEEKEKALRDLLGDSALADHVLSEAASREKDAQDRGVAFKEDNTSEKAKKPVAEAPAEEKPETEDKPEGDETEEVSDDESSDELDALLAELEAEEGEEDESEEEAEEAPEAPEKPESEEAIPEPEAEAPEKKPMAKKKEAEADELEDIEETKESSPFLGDVLVEDYAEMMGNALSVALHPYFSQLGEIATSVKEAVNGFKELHTELKEMQTSIKELRDENAARTTKEATVVATTEKAVQVLGDRVDKLNNAAEVQAKALVRAQNKLKDLEGSATKSAKRYVASEADETVLKEGDPLAHAHPEADPIASFINQFALGSLNQG